MRCCFCRIRPCAWNMPSWRRVFSIAISSRSSLFCCSVRRCTSSPYRSMIPRTSFDCPSPRRMRWLASILSMVMPVLCVCSDGVTWAIDMDMVPIRFNVSSTPSSRFALGSGNIGDKSSTISNVSIDTPPLSRTEYLWSSALFAVFFSSRDAPPWTLSFRFFLRNASRRWSERKCSFLSNTREKLCEKTMRRSTGTERASSCVATSFTVAYASTRIARKIFINTKYVRTTKLQR
mmetsp:Transcript_39422/g.89892  ORF Transcript_39422/g.89892 Transcript_39422/m.89892 type:complete len:234 (+) Transcript_39422:873-1574(+)